MNVNQEKIYSYAKPVWDFLQIGTPLAKSDAIIVCGAQDLRIPKWAAGLVLDNYADFIVMSGGIGRLTPPNWTDGEAGEFAEVAYEAGVAKEKVIADSRSTNSRENLVYGWESIAKISTAPTSLIIICQPFMQRRMRALAEKLIQEDLFPKVALIFPPCPITYDAYPNEVVSKDEMLSIMVGEVQRLNIYPSKGFIIPQSVPAEITTYAEKLSTLGYNKYDI